MSADPKDDDCAEHVWRLGEVHLTARGATVSYQCRRCGAERYQAPGDRPAQPDAY